ncbi:MAG TPA: universal stress protein [Geminicoccaceae bacterium]
MSETILVAIDGSDHAWKALDLAAEIAKNRSARLFIVHVVPYEPMPESLRAFARAENMPVEEEEARFHYARIVGDELTRVAEDRARKAGAGEVVARAAEGRPADQILAQADAEGASMILMGSRGLSDAKALLLGSVSHKVANRATCTCIAVK